MSDEESHTPVNDMRVEPARAEQLLASLSGVKSRVQAVSIGKPVRLVAVSKLKPASDILALHESAARHVHFGENYLQELTEKAQILPSSIRWHFIGALQTNKCARLAQIPNLFVVSSVDAPKKADALNKARGQFVASKEEARRGSKGTEGDDDGNNKKMDEGQDHSHGQDPDPEPEDDRLGVHVQVNTSGEESKSGVPPSETASICKHIIDSCPHLRLRGLMTIGALARSQATTDDDGTENPDFVTLRQTRDEVIKALELRQDELELSMGMSQDYENAIASGSDEVRVGSTIFGERPPRKEAVVKGEVTEGKS